MGKRVTGLKKKKTLKHITESRSFKHFWRPFFSKPIPEAQKQKKKKKKKKEKI
jgi:hypothetical protein